MTSTQLPSPSQPGSTMLEKISARRKETEQLSSKERVITALAHREPDRVPIDLAHIGN